MIESHQHSSTDPETTATADPGPVTPAPRRRAAVRALLRGRPIEVLERLSKGDPLRLRSRVRRHLARRWLLLDEERVLLAVWARCARHAAGFGRRGLERWLDEQVRMTLDELVSRPVESHGPEVAPARLGHLARELGLVGQDLGPALARFNRLPDATRRCFFRVALQGHSLEAEVYAGGPSLVEVARQVRRGLAPFLEVGLEPSASEVRS